MGHFMGVTKSSEIQHPNGVSGYWFLFSSWRYTDWIDISYVIWNIGGFLEIMEVEIHGLKRNDIYHIPMDPFTFWKW